MKKCHFVKEKRAGAEEASKKEETVEQTVERLQKNSNK